MDSVCLDIVLVVVLTASNVRMRENYVTKGIPKTSYCETSRTTRVSNASLINKMTQLLYHSTIYMSFNVCLFNTAMTKRVKTFVGQLMWMILTYLNLNNKQKHRSDCSIHAFAAQSYICPWYHMSRAVRKPAFSICENKDADQLRGNTDQRLCFRYTDSTIPLLPKSEISSL